MDFITVSALLDTIRFLFASSGVFSLMPQRQARRKPSDLEAYEPQEQ
jgi:hypothetical protein